MSASPFTAKAALRVIAASRPEAAADPGVNWRGGLLLKKNLDPKPILANVLHALRHAPALVGLLAWDEFRLRVTIERPTPWGSQPGPWLERDDISATEWMQKEYIDVRPDVVGQAVQRIALEQPRHVVRDYLTSLQWDGVPRVGRWLTRYLGVEESLIAGAFGQCWLISAVARIMKPGAKVDTCLILEGKQGIGKSRALKILAGEFFTDSIPDLHSKDAAVQLAGVWIVELAELDSLGRAESATIKAFMSRQTDRFRPPYGKRAEDAPRQCVFAGSVNESEYLKDATGARRFFPVKCGDVFDLAGLESDRDQLWAEALFLFRAGVPWWLEDEELVQAAVESQAERFDADPWEDGIRYFLLGKPSVTLDHIFDVHLNKPRKDVTQRDKIRVARCLQAIDWERYKYREGGRIVWAYREKD